MVVTLMKNRKVKASVFECENVINVMTFTLLIHIRCFDENVIVII